jgi:hypothetical protein
MQICERRLEASCCRGGTLFKTVASREMHSTDIARNASIPNSAYQRPKRKKCHDSKKMTYEDDDEEDKENEE